jgi:hypothetical protein
MEMSQGKPLYSYLKQTKNIILFFRHMENKRTEQVLLGRLVSEGEGGCEDGV